MNRSVKSTNSTSPNCNRSWKLSGCSKKMPQHEIEDLMGIHGPTCKRVKGGASKQK